MNICMICPGLGNAGGNPFIGGHENNVATLSKALFERGHEISIITTPHLYSGNASTNDNLYWAKVFSLPVHSSYLSLRYGLQFLLQALQKIKKLNDKENFDILHGHSGHPMPALITGVGGKISGIPSIHTLYHTVDGSRSYYSHQFFLSKPISKFYLSLPDKIITLSERTRRSLIGMGIKDEKICVIPPAIDLNRFNPSISGKEVKKQLNLDTNILLYVGDLAKSRGADVLIKALGKIKKQIPEIKLLFAVNMPLEKYKKERLEIKEKINFYDLNNNVIPLGIVNNMPEVMACCDAFIAPYRDIEGIADYPISILEAMAVGKPVIATGVGGIPEIISHRKNGLLVKPNDPVELANAIVYVLNNKREARIMGLEGTKLVSKKFKTEIIVDKLERLYEEVISNYSSNRRY